MESARRHLDPPPYKISKDFGQMKSKSKNAKFDPNGGHLEFRGNFCDCRMKIIASLHSLFLVSSRMNRIRFIPKTFIFQGPPHPLSVTKWFIELSGAEGAENTLKCCFLGSNTMPNTIFA